jgi:hypothetical protein
MEARLDARFPRMPRQEATDMATRIRIVSRSLTVAALAVTASFAVSAPASAAVCEETPENPTGQCVDQPVVDPTPAPVDACPDEALNPGIQAAGPCNVAAAPQQPEEAFVDPAVDVDRGAGTLAYGALDTPAEAGVGPEVVVAGAAAAPAAGGGANTRAIPGELPYTGWSIGSTLLIAISLLLAGSALHLAGRRRVRRLGA